MFYLDRNGIYFRPGKNFGRINNLKPHEVALAKCISQNKKSIWFPLRQCSINFGKEEVGSLFWFDSLVHTPLLKKEFFKREGRFFYSYPLSEKGLAEKERIEDILNYATENLESMVKNDPPKAKSCIEFCGARLLLPQKRIDFKIVAGWYKSLINNIDMDYQIQGTNNRISSVTTRSSRLDFGFLDEFKCFDDFEKFFFNNWIEHEDTVMNS
jgi:hypothetical protein